MPERSPFTSAQNTGYADRLRHKYWHFVNQPFTQTGQPLPRVDTPNALERIPLFLSTLASRAPDALKSYDTAVGLAPEDAYPLYNRGRAHLALGHKDEARTDFTKAADPKFAQAGARKLAQKALEEMSP